MFTWICPLCGHECKPDASECPQCTPTSNAPAGGAALQQADAVRAAAGAAATAVMSPTPEHGVVGAPIAAERAGVRSENSSELPMGLTALALAVADVPEGSAPQAASDEATQPSVWETTFLQEQAPALTPAEVLSLHDPAPLSLSTPLHAGRVTGEHQGAIEHGFARPDTPLTDPEPAGMADAEWAFLPTTVKGGPVVETEGPGETPAAAWRSAESQEAATELPAVGATDSAPELAQIGDEPHAAPTFAAGGSDVTAPDSTLTSIWRSENDPLVTAARQAALAQPSATNDSPSHAAEAVPDLPPAETSPAPAEAPTAETPGSMPPVAETKPAGAVFSPENWPGDFSAAEPAPVAPSVFGIQAVPSQGAAEVPQDVPAAAPEPASPWLAAVPPTTAAEPLTPQELPANHWSRMMDAPAAEPNEVTAAGPAAATPPPLEPALPLDPEVVAVPMGKKTSPAMMALAVGLGITIALFISTFLFARPEPAAKPAPAPVIVPTPAAAAADPGTLVNDQTPYGKYLEVVGMRVTDLGSASTQVKFIVVNHQAAEIVPLKLDLRLVRSGKQLATFAVKVPALGPYQSSEITADVPAAIRPAEVADWKHLSSDFRVSEDAAKPAAARTPAPNAL